MNKPRPYTVATICYDPTNAEHPWYVIRVGTVAEQGGFTVGRDGAWFTCIEDAFNFTREMVVKDEDLIKDLVKRKEEKKEENK